MTGIPKKVEDRLKSEIKRYKKILGDAKSRDINEADTVTIVKDIFSDIFGYDKYQELTSEYAIRSTYCDLAVKLGDKPHLLTEVKAIGLDLKETHLRQAVDYAAKEAIDWVVLTNGYLWEVYRIMFGRPTKYELVFLTDLLEINIRDRSELEKLFLLTKEAIAKQAITAYHEEKQIKNKFVLATLLLQEPVIDVIRRKFNRLSKEIRISNEEILDLLKGEVFKREVLEGEKAKQAEHTVKKKISGIIRKRKKNLMPKNQLTWRKLSNGNPTRPKRNRHRPGIGHLQHA